jgi:hypothetical protein
MTWSTVSRTATSLLKRRPGHHDGGARARRVLLVGLAHEDHAVGREVGAGVAEVGQRDQPLPGGGQAARDGLHRLHRALLHVGGGVDHRVASARATRTTCDTASRTGARPSVGVTWMKAPDGGGAPFRSCAAAAEAASVAPTAANMARRKTWAGMDGKGRRFSDADGLNVAS